jgi:hypothetical protein
LESAAEGQPESLLVRDVVEAAACLEWRQRFERGDKIGNAPSRD